MSEALVLTLELDGESFAQLQAARQRYYPPERNVVPAHVTLFQSLPDERRREIGRLLDAVASRERRIDLEVGEPRALEHGVAFFLTAPRLMALRDELAAEWEPWLAGRDLDDVRPHVTIATTAGEAEARRLAREIGGTVRLRRVTGVGLHLWRYRGGPWEDVRLFRFRG